MVSRRTALMTAAAVATTPIAACSSNRPTPRTNPTDSVGYATGFLTYGRNGHVIVADAKGYFAKAGITVRVVPGTGQPSAIALLAKGNQYQFMETETTQQTALLVTGLAKGTKVVAAIHQHTVIALMSRTSTGITRPQDLARRHIGYGAPAPHDLFPAYAQISGFSTDQRRWEFDDAKLLLGLLAAGKVDAIGQFATGLPAVQAVMTAAHPGEQVTVFPYGDVLLDLYGNALAANEALIERKPDLVRRFTEALLQGLRYSIEHPDEAGVLINKAWPETKAAVAQAELEVMKSYVTANGTQPGALDENRVARAIALLQSVGMVKGAVSTSEFADFTFAPKAQG